MSDAERVAALRLGLRTFREALADAHRLTTDPLVAGDLMRAFALSGRLGLELSEAAKDAAEALTMTTTEPTTAEET